MEKTKSGISLIVLVITIIVLSILAATVIITISNTNVINQANQTTFKSDMVSYKEAYELYITNKLAEDSSFDRSTLNLIYNDANADTFKEIFGEVSEKYQEGLKIQDGKLVYETDDETKKSIADSLGMTSSDTDIPNTPVGIESVDGKSIYIGYYADVNGDGTVDGIIFADLAVSGSGTWSSANASSFSYEAKTAGLKEYVISQASYNITSTSETAPSGYGTMPVIKPVDGTNGEDRFYVMALEDVNAGTNYCWYAAASGSSSTLSNLLSNSFGTGEDNTKAMVSAWNGTQCGAQGTRDVWKVIQDTSLKYNYNNGWFVPSKDEWTAFIYNFGIKASNYSGQYGLKKSYLSSSFNTGTYVWGPDFTLACQSPISVSANSYVRLATKF